MAFTAFHTCDHCGKIIDDMKDYIDIGIDLSVETIYCDLCNDCLKELTKVIKAFVKKEGADNG